MHQGQAVGIAALLVLVAGPSLLALASLLRRSSASATAEATRWDWKLTIASTLLYTFAFNFIFFIQELFLVLPKAFTPGLRPTLFHNNHHWDGEHPLARLFQGTGALATLVTAAICALLLRGDLVRSTTARLLLIWTVYCGAFMALPQVVVGALSSDSDVGMAMDYFALGTTAKAIAAFIALASIATVAVALTRPMLELADEPTRIATARARTRFVAQIATLPALLATALIVPFRVPRELVEVVVLPIVVSVIGIAWIQAGAWRVADANARGESRDVSLVWPLVAVVALLLVFQLVLRPGIAFY
jgi:hypothetical protein